MDESAQKKVVVLAKILPLAKFMQFFTPIVVVGLVGWQHAIANEVPRQAIGSDGQSSIVIANPNAAFAERGLSSHAAFAERAIIVSDLAPVKLSPDQSGPRKSEFEMRSSMVGKKVARRNVMDHHGSSNASSPWVIWSDDSQSSQTPAVSSLAPMESSPLTATTTHRHTHGPLKPVQHTRDPNSFPIVSRAIALEPVVVRPNAPKASRRPASQFHAHLRKAPRPSAARPSGSRSTRSNVALRLRPAKPGRHASQLRATASSMQPRQKSATMQQGGRKMASPPAGKLSRTDAALLKANEISQAAKTEADYTKMIRLCAGALRQPIEGEKSDFARKLSAWALNRRGQLRADENQNELAMADFSRALEYVPDHWRALHNRGVTNAQAGRYAEAFDDFNRVIELNPTYAKAYSNRATLYVQAGDLQAALDQYARAIRLDKNLVTAQVGRGRVCHQLGRLEEALEHLNAAVKLEPKNARIVCSRADLLADMGRYRAAMADYARAIDLNPEFAHAYRNGAWLLATCPDAELRDARNALIGAQRALEFGYGQRHVALDTLAAAQANAGQFDKAIVSLQQAMEIAPQAARQAYEVRLQLYEQHQPFRTTPLSDVHQAGYEQ